MLKLSSAARKQTSTGEMVNLMAVDANRLQQVPNLTTVFWSMPLLSIISIVLLYTVMGPSALVVLAMLLIIIPINGIFIANMIRKLQVGASLGRVKLLFCCHYMYMYRPVASLDSGGVLR